MAELISVPLKKPTDVDIIKPLKNLIDSNYSTADKPEDYTEQINELSKLRNAAVWRAFEKYESSLEVIYSYYDQLCALEVKIPPSEVQIPFKWKDAFGLKNSIFGGRISLTISSLAYERVCVLFNIAALQSSVASSQTIDNDEGLKLAAKLFQQSAGVFNHLKGTVMASIQQDPTPDLNPDTLVALSSLMLAQAQEIFVHKAIHDNMKDAVTAKLASQCEELYAEALKLMQKDSVRPIWDKDWILIVAGKQAIFHGMAEFYQSLVCKANKAVGEEIARLQNAIELLKAGQQRSGKPSMANDLVNRAQRHLAEAQKDNDFIYHERIPDPKSLNTVPRVSLAKSLPMPQRFSANFKDLFDKLVPMPVHQAMAAYEVRKSELVNSEVSKLREATQLLNSCLASLNLPAALEDTSGQELPQSLIDKAEAVRNLGGVRQLDTMIRDLPELLQRNRDILDEADRMLNDEYQSDEQLRQQFKERWKRTPSAKLTETFRANAAKYREIINNAINADKLVKEKYEQHRRGMELLSEGPTVMAASVPAAGPSGATAHNSSAAGKLRGLMDKVETLKAERDVIECELKCASSDMKDQFLSALSDGSINEQALSVETLGRAYGPLQKQVKESLDRQEALLGEIQTTNTEFCREKSGAGSLAQKREACLKELAAAHDAFVELLNNLKEGSKFYNDLTQLLVVFQNKISDYCFARKTEKEELLKDLTRDLSHGPVGVVPNAPAHHGAPAASASETDSSAWPSLPSLSKFTSYLSFGSGAEAKKQPPPRPPPPSAAPGAPSAASLPYPMQPQGMPIPYGPNAAAPYPTYALPPGYNPYHTLPAYPHQAYQQYPQYPPQYGNYPPVQYPPGQQPPPPQNQW